MSQQAPRVETKQIAAIGINATNHNHSFSSRNSLPPNGSNSWVKTTVPSNTIEIPKAHTQKLSNLFALTTCIQIGLNMRLEFFLNTIPGKVDRQAGSENYFFDMSIGNEYCVNGPNNASADKGRPKFLESMLNALRFFKLPILIHLHPPCSFLRLNKMPEQAAQFRLWVSVGLERLLV